jgi:large subunit ribosomal protein L3
MENCQVVEIKKSIAPRSKERKVNLLVGAGAKDVRQLNKGQMVAFRKAGLEPKEKLVEFPITLDAILPVGTRISARHFVPGQYLDIVGTSKDKGFAGVMKRHGFKGQLASHGVSLTHRHLGSTGACQNPSKVWPGKKMPGHMGNKRCTFNNMQLYKIDVERDLLFIRGSVPGKNGSWVHLQDAVRRPWIESNPPPFPTFEPVEGEEDPHEIIMDVSHLEDVFIHG